MGIKSRLFASAAFPLLSLSLIFPANGFAAVVAGPAPQHKISGASAADPMSFEVAQDAPQPEDPLLIPPGKKPEEQPPEQQPEPAPAPEPQPEAPSPELQQEQPAPAAPQEEAPAPAPPPAAEQPAPEPQAQPEPPKAAPAEEPAPAEQPAPQAEPQQPAATQEQPPEKKRDKKDAATGEKKRPGKGDKKPDAEEPPPAPAADTAPIVPDAPAPADTTAPAQPSADQPAAQPVEPKPQDAPTQAPADGSAPVQQTAPVPQDEGQAANAPISEPPPIPAPEKITPQELKRREQIAADPAKSTETVILPVENGAAVLDSDKESQRSGTPQSREERQKLRAQEKNVKVPTSDADAQLAPQGQPQPPVKIEAVTSEQGQRLNNRPDFVRPDGARVGEQKDNRIILEINNNVVVRSDDDRRFLRDGGRPEYEQLSRDRYRETIERPEGYRIVTVRNRYGDIIQRSRIDSRGREYVLYYSPELSDDPDQDYFRDPAEDLPPMRLRVPLRDYIIDTTTDPNRDYYDFLAQPPVERVERVYSLNEVKYSARIRDKVPRIDLDTVTFATGSAEIPMAQAKTLRKVADAINEVLQKDQSETFLIEGHTDAVGSDQSNLILSDQRAESVANVLTDVYGIPPENLATQGYGERYLKVNTANAEQANRRVTVRRVTALVRPVAANK